MRLNHNGRENYELQVDTTDGTGAPIAASAWEASFDDGANWVAATVVVHNSEDWSTWLVAGPDAELGDAVAVITASQRPLVRAIANPQILVDEAPQIYLY